MIPKAVLPDFQDFLLSQKLAPEKNVPYLANWVSKFLAFSNRKGQADIGRTVAGAHELSAHDDLYSCGNNKHPRCAKPAG